jgi:hypothetical protein
MAVRLQAVGSAIGKPVGALLLGGVILWQVAGHAGPPNGRVLVHASTTPVDIVVDDHIYRVEDLDHSPVVCELRPGPHTAQMVRDGQVLYREEFSVKAGEEVVLVAWDQYDDGRSPGRGKMNGSAPGRGSQPQVCENLR